MKLFCLTFAVIFSLALQTGSSSGASDCVQNEEYNCLLCGEWSEEEIEEVMISLIGDEEIHKIVKQDVNYYLLHTCDDKTDNGVCRGGVVYVIERDDGMLEVRSESWSWFQ